MVKVEYFYVVNVRWSISVVNVRWSISMWLM